MSKKIGYKLGGSFSDCGQTTDYGFDILFPRIYTSYEEAERHNRNVSANMVCQNEEIVIELYENNKLVDTIHWDEWWKYKCICLKQEAVGLGYVDGNTDYEPCSLKFEEIFKEYAPKKDRWNMQYLAYWVEAIILQEEDKKEK